MSRSNTELIIGILLSLGTIISYLPQYIKIIKNEKVDGISHWSQGLNNISAFCAFFGAFMLDFNIFKTCPQNSNCGKDLMPFIQLFFVWLCPLINYVIFIKYYNQNIISVVNRKIQEHHKVIGFFIFYCTVFLFCFIMTTIVLVANWETWKEHGILFGRILSIISTIITSFIWIPQIVTTWKSKAVGSLSLISLAIQAPGSFIIFIYQVVVSNSSWYIGVPYLVTAIFQLFLLFIGYIFERKRRIVHDRTYALYNNGELKLSFLCDDELAELELLEDDNAILGQHDSF